MTTATTSRSATANQMNFIRSLVSERKATVGVTNVDAFVEAIRSERLTSEGASRLIDTLLATPKDAPVVVPAAPGAPASNRGTLKSNGYAGKCALCGGHVAVGAGTYRPKSGTRGFDTLHLPNECPNKATAIVANDGKAADSWDFLKHLTQEEFPDGYFAVPSVTGHNDLSFFSVKSNKGFYDPSKKGQRIFKHVVGGGQEFPVTPSFFVKCIEAAKALGFDESAALYGKELGQCGRCGRDLTDEISRARGIGPTCLGKSWF